MKKYYTLILAFLLTQGAMAIDYEQLRSSSKLNAASKTELFKLQQEEETTIAKSKASGSKLKALRQQMDNRSLRVLIRMTPGSDASTLASDGITLTTVVNHFAIVTISAQGQAKGIYVLRISDGKQTHAQKVVVR